MSHKGYSKVKEEKIRYKLLYICNRSQSNYYKGNIEKMINDIEELLHDIKQKRKASK